MMKVIMQLILMNHPHHPEGDDKADAQCWINNFSKELQSSDHLLLPPLNLLAVQLLHGHLLYFLVYANQS